MTDIISGLVEDFNAALKAGNIERAVQLGDMAVRHAKDDLAKTSISASDKAYCERIVASIEPFLKNPVPLAAPKKAAGKGASTPSEDKIKSTDWFDAPIPDLRLNNIAGLKLLKEQFILNIFSAMHPRYSKVYKKYRGEDGGLQVLLYGAPGCGKTFAVRCLAGELGCKIAVVEISKVMANLVGDGAKTIAEIFEQAKKYDKCIIFFDEIDAIASSREDEDSRHTKEQLTMLLTCMDGFTGGTKPGQVRIVIAATNRPWALDSAVKRGGRFDTQIFVPMPDHEARAQLISNALRKGKDGEDEIPCAPDTTVEWLADRFDGYAGADIKAMCRQAASQPLKREILALQKGVESPDCITRKDVELVLSRYINSITDSDLMRYDAYSMNMELDDAYIMHKADQLIGRLYRKEALEPYEARLIKDLWEKGYLKDKFGDKYDLDLFMDERLKALKK